MIDPGIFRYFRACYQADNGRIALTDIYHKNVEHRIFIEERDEIHTGLLHAAAVAGAPAEAARDRAWAYRKEKDLIYCSLLLMGQPAPEDENGAFICGPLMMYPAEITLEDSVGFARPDLARGDLNRGLIERLPCAASDILLEDRVAEILDAGPITPGMVVALANLLEASVPNMEVTAALHWPDLVDEAEVRRRIRALKCIKESSFCLLPVSLIALVPKPRGSRDVLNELEGLAGAEILHSKPLQSLFADSPRRPFSFPIPLADVPAVLSGSQMEILRAAAVEPLTLVTGPPGTGKSFTIAAVVTEHLARNRSVLVVSKMNHAVDVIADKIEAMTGIADCCIRGGSSDYLRGLKARLENMMSGIGLPDNKNLAEELKSAKQALCSLLRRIARLERRILRISNREMKWGRTMASGQQGPLGRLWKRLSRLSAGWAEPLWELVAAYDELVAKRIEKSAQIVRLINLQRQQQAISCYRKNLNSFMDGLKARTGDRKEKFFQEASFKKIIETFPIWLVNVTDLHSVLPLQRELFDLVIIDEATQCDIASCLPALQRGHRLLVFGDPHQLRHISFLARARQQEFFAKFGLDGGLQERFDYREKSFLDLVSESIVHPEQVIFLNEHFRSRPAIIQFSNRRFYAGALRIMTEKPGIERPAALVLWTGEGKRLADGSNQQEAERLVQRIHDRIQESRHLPDHLVPSIGIISPFRGQVTLLTEMLLKRFERHSLDRHRLLVGTAHTFQGEERDCVYISLALDPAYNPSSLRFLESPGVFNVTVTRARTYQEIHLSLEERDLPEHSLTRAYLAHASRESAPKLAIADNNPSADRFLDKVKAELEKHGIQVASDQTVAGFLMDLVAVRANRLLVIDLIGYPGRYEDFIPLEHYRIYSRAGLDIFSLPYSKWVTKRQLCLDALCRYFDAG